MVVLINISNFDYKTLVLVRLFNILLIPYLIIIINEDVMIFMGNKNISTIFCMWLSLVIQLSFITRTLITAESSGYNSLLLDDFVDEYVESAVRTPRTGILYNISLPSNYSGVEVTYVRLKSGSLWSRGRNSSLFRIPTRIVTSPHVNRLDIVFQNLGNLSSYYFSLPNYTFVSPVIGFQIYGADANYSSSNGSRNLKISLRGDPVVVRFPSVSLKQSDIATMKCARFGTSGTEVEFSNVNAPDYTCNARNQGHFAIVVPSLLPPSTMKVKKREKLWLWLIIGGGGFVLLILGGFFVFKSLRARKIDSMEKKSEKSEALEIVWIGRSKMPSASGIRTQPVLENDDYP